MKTLRTETEAGVRQIVLCRADAYNTITPALRDELAAAIDAADADRERARDPAARRRPAPSAPATASTGRRAAQAGESRAQAAGRAAPRLGLGRRPAHDGRASSTPT